MEMNAAVDAILRPEVLLTYNSDAREIIIKEDDPGARLQKLYIRKLPIGTVGFELDHKPTGLLKKNLKNAFKQLSCLVNSSHSIANKKCDAVLIVPDGDGAAIVLLIDLKSEAPKRADCKKQLNNSRLYFEYLSSLMREYHGVDINWRFKQLIVFSARPMHVKPLTQQRAQNAPEVVDGVTYISLTLGGWKNSEGILMANLI